MRRALPALLALFGLLAIGCGPPPMTVIYPGELQPVSSLGADVMLRQHIVGVRGEERWELDVVLQKRGDSLLLLALTPFGTRMFAFEQEGANEPRLETFIEVAPPFPPRFVLLDVQRVLMVSSLGAAAADGEHVFELGEESVRERWEGGALMERAYERLDGDPAGGVEIDYGEGMRGGVLPPRVTLQNGWAGYDLVIETLSRQPI